MNAKRWRTIGFDFCECLLEELNRIFYLVYPFFNLESRVFNRLFRVRVRLERTERGNLCPRCRIDWLNLAGTTEDIMKEKLSSRFENTSNLLVELLLISNVHLNMFRPHDIKALVFKRDT
jgi:hypothetical protein